MEPISWQELEYTPKEKKPDFYWSLGIIAVALGVSAFVYSNPILGILILVGAFSIAIISLRKPRMMTYEISERGISINGEFFSYRSIEAFYFDRKYYGHLVLRLGKGAFATETINLPEGVDIDELHNFFEEIMPEKETEMIETPFHLLFERIGI